MILKALFIRESREEGNEKDREFEGVLRASFKSLELGNQAL